MIECAKKIHTEVLCVKKTDGSEFCANGNQLEAAVNMTGIQNIIVSNTYSTGTTSTGSSIHGHVIRYNVLSHSRCIQKME